AGPITPLRPTRRTTMRHHGTTMLAAALALACAGLCTAMPARATDAPDATALRETANTLFGAIPHRVDEVRGQEITAAQVELGKSLWFEPRLSRSHVLSCNSCHNIATGGADNVPTSIGHGWQKGPRNSPTVLNAVLNIAQFWDGRAADLKEQAKGPVQASVEMNATPKHVEDTLKSIPEYVELFKTVFPGQKDPVTFDNMAEAIEAFETLLVTPNSRFDQWLGGKEVLTLKELGGLDNFVNKGCISCHSGVNFGGQAYFPFGVVKRPGADVLPAGDKGRFE